jgi:hypothetical protein
MSEGYAGAWRRQSTYVDRALPPGPGVDPAHLRPDLRDPGQVPAGYPRTDFAPLFLTQPSDDAYAHEVDTPGVTLDVEPITHESGEGSVIHPAPVQGAKPGSPTLLPHDVSRGADKRMILAPTDARAHDEKPLTERWEQEPIAVPSLVAVQRGTNALAVNNPDGFRNGWSVRRFYHRWMPHEYMRHDERPLRPGGAASAVQSPAVAAGAWNRYVSPFGWNQVAAGSLLQLPIMRRNPPQPQDAPGIGDGSADASPVPGDWVVG